MTYLKQTISKSTLEFNIEYSISPDNKKVLYQIKTINDPWEILKPLYLGISSLDNIQNFINYPTKSNFIKLYPINEENLSENYSLFFISPEEKNNIYNLNDIDISKYIHDISNNELSQDVFNNFHLGKLEAYIYSPSNIIYDLNNQLVSFIPYLDFYNSLFPNSSDNGFINEKNQKERKNILISYIEYINENSYLFSEQNILKLQKQKRILLGLETESNVRIHGGPTPYSIIPKINPEYIYEACEYYRNIQSNIIHPPKTPYNKSNHTYQNDMNLIKFCSVYLFVRQKLHTLLKIDVKEILDSYKQVNLDKSFNLLNRLIHTYEMEKTLDVKEYITPNSTKKLKV